MILSGSLDVTCAKLCILIVGLTDCIESAMHICINMLKCLFCQLMLMKKSEVKTCTGNGLLDIWGLVIQSLFMVGVTMSPIN